MIRKHTRHTTKKLWIISALLVLVAAGILAALELTGTTYLFRNKPLQSSTIPTKSPDGADDTNGADQDGPQPNQTTSEPAGSDKNNSAASSGGEEVVAPYGTFISSHVISLGDPRAENQESICITTPGANCKIEFKKGDVVKTLETKKVGSDGSVIWNWNLKDADLREGTWEIIASAWLNDDIKTTTDPLKLEVKP